MHCSACNNPWSFTSSTRGPCLWSWTQTSSVVCMRPKFASSMGSPEISIFQFFPTVYGGNGSSCDEWELPPEYPSRGRRGVYGEHVGSYGETEEGTPQSTYSTTWEKNKLPSNNGAKKERAVRKKMMRRVQVQKNGGSCSRQPTQAAFDCSNRGRVSAREDRRWLFWMQKVSGQVTKGGGCNRAHCICRK